MRKESYCLARGNEVKSIVKFSISTKKSLQFGGRAILVKSYMYCVPLYMFCFYRLLVGFGEKMDMIRRSDIG
jgi:hypothetical protein